MCVHRRGFVWVALLIWPLFCRPAPGESLDSAWLVALANDQRLKSANALVSAAQSGVASAKAERCPNAGVSVGYTARDKIQAYDSNIPGSTIVPTSQRDSVNSVAFVNQPLYTFGRIRSTIEAARDKTCVAQAEVDQIVQEIKLNVASAYADVLHFRHNVDVAKATVTSLTGHLKDVRNRVGQGVAISNELLATQVKLANAQQQVLAEQ
ncbi:MAG TPA: TolC family protein, partial [Pirellulales bacterium]|nr:TolC family protein [Pirellulales bacterium]